MDAMERVLSTLNHEEPDKVPYFESTFTHNTIMRQYGVKIGKLGSLIKILNMLPFKNKIIKKTFTSEKALIKGLMPLAKFYRNAGIDLIPSISALFPREIIKNGFVDEFGRCTKFQYYKDGTEILGYAGGYFKNFDDYESWEQPDPNWEARVVGFMAGRKIQEKMNNEIFFMGSTTGMMEVTWEGFGIENFSRLMARRKQLKKVFDDRGKFCVETVKILAENDAKLVLIFDDYGFKNGLFMSPKKYRDLVLPWLKRACKVAHERDCKIMLHSDGDLAEILDDIVNDCRIDALNPIEPNIPNEDYDIYKIHEKHGDKLTLVGNVPPVMLAEGTASEIKEYTTTLIKKIAPGGGYILASGHSINPAVKVENWQAMMDVKNAIGNYPIS
ncbi:MAG: uroporphyrinogen decarboxylase family protein [Promethearchaeota archaeon]